MVAKSQALVPPSPDMRLSVASLRVSLTSNVDMAGALELAQRPAMTMWTDEVPSTLVLLCGGRVISIRPSSSPSRSRHYKCFDSHKCPPFLATVRASQPLRSRIAELALACNGPQLACDRSIEVLQARNHPTILRQHGSGARRLEVDLLDALKDAMAGMRRNIRVLGYVGILGASWSAWPAWPRTD